nr:MAG TPA: hypothetical protein [Caudoviricetes sp.]
MRPERAHKMVAKIYRTSARPNCIDQFRTDTYII